MTTISWHKFPPYGCSDLKQDVSRHYAQDDSECIRGEEILCCIHGCEHWLRRRRIGREATYCPKHRISLSPTAYIHEKSAQNLIIHPELFQTIQKAEDRLANENSEDALTWNIFVACFAVEALAELFFEMTGLQPKDGVELYLWGNRFLMEGCVPWRSFQELQQILEPHKPIKTEPDIMLRVPGQALVVVEAKFLSPNSRYSKGGKAERYGTTRQYFTCYPATPGCPDPLNREWIYNAPREQVLEQLCRHAVYAHRLAQPCEKVFLVNLVCSDLEAGIEKEFAKHLASEEIVFRRHTWESVATLRALHTPAGEHLREYLAEKTFRLRPAFPSLHLK